MAKLNKILILSAILLAGAADFSWCVDVSMHALGRKSGLPDTGQVLCYDGTGGIIGCPAPGVAMAQDGSYSPASASPSFSSYVLGGSDAVTVDNRTGLMWAKDGAAGGCNFGGPLIWTGALGFCEALTFATYSDWRLPNIRELFSILDFTVTNPAVNTTYFLNTQLNYYWSSTTRAGLTANAWALDFSSAGSGYQAKGGAGYYVRCVRGGPQ